MTAADEDQFRAAVSAVAQQMREVEQQAVIDMTEEMLEIEGLSGDPVLEGLLLSSVQGNITTMNAMLADDIPLANLQPTTAAVEYALRLAQREVPANSLMRAYRLGEFDYNRRVMGIVEQLALTPELTVHVTRHLMSVTFEYIDWISRLVFNVYEQERRRWIGVEGNVLSSTVNQFLAADGEPLPHEAESFEAETGYRLDQRHLAVILWAADRTVGVDRIDRAARDVAVRLGAVGRPVVTAADRSTVWLWVPLGTSAAPAGAESISERVAVAPSLRMAYGLPGTGIAGFRRSHQQAQAAYQVATLAGGPGPAAVVGFGDRGIAVVSVMARDLPSTRAWVREVLGPLAVDSPAAQVLRETLSVFLACRESHVRTAERMLLHRNTVKYRIGKAMETVPANGDRMDLALALTVCEYLGSDVLAAA
ncbi:putative CdaR family transcriptional regulator [Gordonia hirsuta DSM 44140 = NBRC 16056]|uniref:Putative CdaR family transcriptional regulator n=1 Tax=Gordonia hirsuta DSM 44140 = NBRC 16056 TaxID=1121927 RepID=L7LC89_9ACTN|nr:helix-turn-helix domain-containing protein [Gordonia hirsuta]GAC57697.1 putative CdaR family transcriptional regulator [Gordonia hirsuta DSM 44140 = NBRC 16056]